VAQLLRPASTFVQHIVRWKGGQRRAADLYWRWA